MTDFLIKRLPYNLTAQAGLSLVGQYLKRFAQIDQIIDPRFPISGQGGIATSSLLKAYVGLLCTGKSDFDAIESRRQDAFFRDALGLVAVPSSPTLHQRMDALADSGEPALTALDEANERLLTNDLVLSLAVLAFNILRAIGQATLISPDSPVRHPAKRRRIRTVMQEIIGIAARVIQHARRLTLGLGECCAAFAVFERHHQALLQFSD